MRSGKRTFLEWLFQNLGSDWAHISPLSSEFLIATFECFTLGSRIVLSVSSGWFIFRRLDSFLSITGISSTNLIKFDIKRIHFPFRSRAGGRNNSGRGEIEKDAINFTPRGIWEKFNCVLGSPSIQVGWQIARFDQQCPLLVTAIKQASYRSVPKLSH